MKRLYSLFGVLVLLSLSAFAQVTVSGTVATSRLAVKAAYCDFYKVEPKVVDGLVVKKISDDDISVTLFLSNQAKVAPDVVVGYRTKGMSWADITIKLGIKPDVYFTVLPDNPGPPYGKAWGYWKKRKAQPTLTFSLGDDDLRDLVQLRLVSEHYQVKPEDVIKWRGSGKAFDLIIGDEHGRKKGHGKPADDKGASKGDQKDDDASGKPGKGHGKGKGK